MSEMRTCRAILSIDRKARLVGLTPDQLTARARYFPESVEVDANFGSCDFRSVHFRDLSQFLNSEQQPHKKPKGVLSVSSSLLRHVKGAPDRLSSCPCPQRRGNNRGNNNKGERLWYIVQHKKTLNYKLHFLCNRGRRGAVS